MDNEREYDMEKPEARELLIESGLHYLNSVVPDDDDEYEKASENLDLPDNYTYMDILLSISRYIKKHANLVIEEAEKGHVHCVLGIVDNILGCSVYTHFALSEMLEELDKNTTFKKDIERSWH